MNRMKEIWSRKLDSFKEEIKKVSSATGQSFDLSEDQRNKTLKEFKKTDRARLRAFISIINKLDEKEESGTSNDGEKVEAKFSKELKVLRILDSVDLFIKQYEKGEHSTLEPRQVESLVKIAAFLRSGKRRGYVELPTGLGKTVIFAELIEALKDVPDMKILVVGSGNINAIQNVQKVERFSGGEVGQYFADKKELHAKVTVCNYNGLRNAISNGSFKSGDFDLVLLDEVHDGLGKITQESINKTFKKETIIGFSATATYELLKGRTASDFLPIEIDKMGVVEAVKGNLLSAFNVEIIKVPIVLGGIRVRHGDYLPGELEKNINTKERNDLIVDSYISFYRREGSKTIAFCTGRQHTRDLASVFEAKGIKSGVLTGELDIDEREAVLQKWKNGEIEVLCGSKLSWQSLDETEATIGLNVKPSLSEKDVIQRGGRLLRRSQVRNNKRATIVEFLDEWRENNNRPVFYSEVLETAEAQPDKWTSDVSGTGLSEATPVLPEIIETASVSPVVEIPVEIKSSAINTTQEKEITDSGVVRYFDTNQVMEISNRNRKFRNEGYFEYAPKEWMSANIIAVEVGATTKEVDTIIFNVAKEISRNKFEKSSGVYLSSLGIKRIFYGPEILDKVYIHLIGSTRIEKIKSGTLEIARSFDELEKESLEKDHETQYERQIDLEYRDYDLLPSFTLEGDSLEDEEEGVNIGDISELHPEGEQIEGKLSDLIGYRYSIQGGKMGNYRSSLKKPKIERMLKQTERYGLHPVRGLRKNNLDFRSEIEEQEMEKIMMDIISSPDILTDRERTVVSMLYLNNEDEKNTQDIVGEHFGVTGSLIGGIRRRALRKIREAIDIYERTGKIAPDYAEAIRKPTI